MKAKRRRRHTLVESVQFDKTIRVDKENGIVRDVKVVGLKSRHGYEYTPQALQGAIPLYEGVRVNIDHPDRKTPDASRSYRDRFGMLTNVHFVEGDGLRADLAYNPDHALANQFAWDAKHNPTACGFSHNARGPLRQRGQKLLCESIDAVRSVDLVADAATTRSLFEGKPRMKIRKRSGGGKPSKLSRLETRRALVEAYGRDTAAALLEALDPAAAQQLAGAAESGGAATAGNADGSNVEALLALIRQVLADPGITAEESIKLVSKRLKALKEMIPGGSNKDAGAAAGVPADQMAGEGDDEDEDEDDRLEDEGRNKGGKGARKPASGSVLPEGDRKLLDRLAKREARLAVRELCEDAGFKPTDKQVAILLATDDEDTQADLIESWQEANPLPRRKIGAPRSRDILESEGGDGKPTYKDAKDWASGLRV